MSRMREQGARRGMMLLVLALAGVAAGDTIVLAPPDPAISNCEVKTIAGGSVFFADERGRLHSAPLEHVRAIEFDSLPEVAAAEEAFARRDARRAIDQFIRALHRTESPTQRLWLHARLAAAHDAAGEYVQAAGHCASVFLLEDDASWVRLAPKGRPGTASYPAAAEAMHALARADAEVRTVELAGAIDLMLLAVRPVYERLRRAHTGEPWTPGSTISGIPLNELDADDEQAAPPGETLIAPAAQPAANSSGDDQIEQRLRARDFEAALALCERAAAQPGERSLPTLLLQCGRALAGAGRPRDAAVMFMRCALLFPESRQAAPCLLETAVIYRDTFANAATARRLADRALAAAGARDDQSTAMRAREFLATLPSSTPPSGDG